MGYEPIKGLRPYQIEIVAAVVDHLDDYRRILYTAATSCGKTVCFASLTRIFVCEYKWNVLILCDRKELIEQAYTKVRDYGKFSEEVDIDVEQGTNRMNPGAKVIVGSIQTCTRPGRLAGWIPDVIICDEAHICASPSWRNLFLRFPEARIIGCTATAKRLDKQVLFAERRDGSRVSVRDRESKRERPVEAAETVFDKLVYEYPLLQGVEDGYLVEPQQIIVKSDIDLSAVPVRKNRNGDIDFVEDQLNGELESSDEKIVKRINLAITAWRKSCSHLPTVVFAPSVRYARKASELFHKAGFTAQAIDGASDTHTYDESKPWIAAGAGCRERLLNDVHSGALQVVCNCGIYTKGTDVDKWACAIMLRPTASWTLYMQMSGRVGRPLQEVAKRLSDIETAEERREAIAQSGKPFAYIIDVVDICRSHSLCTVPAIVDLPCDFDLQGGKISDAARLMEEFKEVADEVLDDCPGSLQELGVRLEYVRLLRTSKARTRGHWSVRPDGTYSHGKLPPGYSALLENCGEAWRLTVVHTQTGEILYQPESKPPREGSRRPVEAYFDNAEARALQVVQEHQRASRSGMLAELSEKQLWILRKNNFSDEAIDKLTKKQAHAIIGQATRRYYEGKKKA